MKITSIHFVERSAVPVTAARDTQRAKNVAQITEQIKKAPQGKDLVIAGEDVKKYERYQLQKALHKAGAKVLVLAGNHPETGKPALFIKRLTDKEFAEWQKA